MLCFYGENKPGFAKGTRSVTLRYIRSAVTKFYCTDPERFVAIKQGKKVKGRLVAKIAACRRGRGYGLGCRVRVALE